MTSQEFGDILLQHWRLLWPLPAKERARVINEIASDLEYEEQLRIVKMEMSS